MYSKVQNVAHNNSVQTYGMYSTIPNLDTVILYRVMVCALRYRMLYTAMLYRVVCTVKYKLF